MCSQYEIVYTGADVQKVTLKLLCLWDTDSNYSSRSRCFDDSRRS